MDDSSVREFLAKLPEAEARRLGAMLEKSPKIRDWARAAATLPQTAVNALATAALDLENAARLAKWDSESQIAILAIFETLAPSKQKKRQWLDWLEDISRREKLLPAEILESPELREALIFADGKRAAAEEAARRLLWRRRHPELARLTDKRRAQIKALALPQNMKLEADPTFEDIEFSLNITFSTPDELHALAQKFSELAKHPDMLAMMTEGA